MKDEIIAINTPKIVKVNFGLCRAKTLGYDILGKFLFCTKKIALNTNISLKIQKKVFSQGKYIIFPNCES